MYFISIYKNCCKVVVTTNQLTVISLNFIYLEVTVCHFEFEMQARPSETIAFSGIHITGVILGNLTHSYYKVNLYPSSKLFTP